MASGPRPLNFTILLLAASLLLAGCATKNAIPSPGVSSTSTQSPATVGPKANVSAVPARSMEPKTFSKEGSLAAGAGVPENSAGLPPRWVEVQASKCLEVDVGAGATGMVAEVAWKDPAPAEAQHLTLHAISPDGQSDTYAAGDPLAQTNHGRLQIVTPASGGWNVCAQASGVNADVSYTLYGTVFYTPVPTDYTAITK